MSTSFPPPCPCYVALVVSRVPQFTTVRSHLCTVRSQIYCTLLQRLALGFALPFFTRCRGSTQHAHHEIDADHVPVPVRGIERRYLAICDLISAAEVGKTVEESVNRPDGPLAVFGAKVLFGVFNHVSGRRFLSA